MNTTVSGLPAPDYWMCIDVKRDEEGIFMQAWRRTQGEAITVIETIAPKSDGRNWLHVSVAKPNQHKMPTWDDIQTLRNLFVGEHRECYMIFPTQERYVSFFDVLHLFACLDSPEGVLPRMEGIIEGLGLSV